MASICGKCEHCDSDAALPSLIERDEDEGSIRKSSGHDLPKDFKMKKK